MLVIRLKRIGKKNKAQFRIVLQEKQQAPRAKALEILGHINPHVEDDKKLNKERIQHWLSQGAQPSPTMHNLFITEGILKGEKKRVVTSKKKVQGEDKDKAAGETKAAA